MAELADAADSKSAGLRPLGVQVPLPAPALPADIQDLTAQIEPQVHLCVLADYARNYAHPAVVRAFQWRQ